MSCNSKVIYNGEKLFQKVSLIYTVNWLTSGCSPPIIFILKMNWISWNFDSSAIIQGSQFENFHYYRFNLQWFLVQMITAKYAVSHWLWEWQKHVFTHPFFPKWLLSTYQNVCLTLKYRLFHPSNVLHIFFLVLFHCLVLFLSFLKRILKLICLFSQSEPRKYYKMLWYHETNQK